MNKIFLIILLLNLSLAHSQKNKTEKFKKDKDSTETIPFTKLTFELPDCPYTIKNARTDIKNKSIKIVIQGGFTGFGNIDESKSQAFQKKYNVKFEFVGCIKSWNPKTEDITGYNSTIFRFLTKKYGTSVNKEFHDIWLK